MKTPLTTQDFVRPGIAGEAELALLLDRVFIARKWDFRNYKASSLKRRISKRLVDLKLRSYGEYMEVLEKDPSEYARLFSSLTVKVSEFFREPRTFEAIRGHVESLGAPGGLRAWCCGCAHGEEAYSLAIVLSEALTEDAFAACKVFATDIDRGALEAARRALYREESLQNVGRELRDRYFLKTGGLYKVKYSLRNAVTFGVLDIVRDNAFSRIDIVLCRNLFIYFNKSLQAAAFEKLDYALVPGGLMVLGKAEVVPQPFSSRYEPMGHGTSVYRKRS